LLWVSWSKLHLFLEQYLPDYIVYDYVDDIPAWGAYLPKMVAHADIVVTTAGILKNQIDQMFPSKPTHLIPNGCDVRHFQKFAGNPPEKPVEYQEHSGPIIGYIGAWAHWIDHDLVRQITLAFPEALFSVIGVEYGINADRSIPNLRYLGYKPYEVLPQYLYYCDVCVIPFRINQITVATNPIKVYEYLAAGKPVVATDLPEVRNIPFVYIGSDQASFIAHLKGVLSSSRPFDVDAVNRWLSAHTWERRYQSIRQMLHSI
jgi:glycosyltransferase involved in cell wall biosynthesis